jgi:hypothetical protein
MHQDQSFSPEMRHPLSILAAYVFTRFGVVSFHCDISFDFPTLGSDMRRVFRASSFCIAAVRHCRELIQHLSIAVILASFLALAPPLRAQSSTGALPTIQAKGGNLHAGIVPELRTLDLASGWRSDHAASLLAPPRPGELQSTDATDKAPSPVITPRPQPSELSRDVYYRNRLEFALEIGYLPINIPFVFDVFLGDGYNMTPLKYTLVPVVGSLRWQIDDIEGPWIFRGNWDMTFSGSVTAIPRGPENHFYSYDMGLRRNFVPRRGKIAPYFDGRAGMGRIDAKEPLGVAFAQGQNFTFTIGLGSGVRYNFNSRYSLSAGLNWMHISNMYLSQPKFSNYGINVYGPLFGVDIRLGKPRSHASE